MTYENETQEANAYHGDIVMGNRLIAEFAEIPYKFPRIRFRTGEAYEEEILPNYHTDWNHLMPVVEKIEKDFCNDFELIIYSSSCHIHKWDKHKQDYDTFISGVGKKIDAVWSAVVQFIQWYNSPSGTISKQ